MKGEKGVPILRNTIILLKYAEFTIQTKNSFRYNELGYFINNSSVLIPAPTGDDFELDDIKLGVYYGW